MKKIKLQKSYTITGKVNLAELPPGPFNSDTIIPSTKPHTDEISAARENASEVFWGTLAIESKFDEIIIQYFYGEIPSKKYIDFENIFLKSDILSYSQKRKVLLSLVHNHRLLEGAEITKFEENIKNIMDYRNSMAHGKMIASVNDNSVALKYFIGSNRNDTLDDNYWDKLENTYKETNDILDNISEKIKHLTSQSS